MRAEFVIAFDIDSAVLELEAKRRGLTLPRALESFLSECENRLIDAVRFRDGVTRVGSNVRNTANSGTSVN